MQVTKFARRAGIIGSAFLATAVNAASLELKVLSSRPDMVSGGDALIGMTVPAGARAEDVALALNDMPITVQWHQTGGEFRALISGLKVGTNTLGASVKMPKKGTAKLKLTN